MHQSVDSRHGFEGCGNTRLDREIAGCLGLYRYKSAQSDAQPR
jgi:hypothetical protein